MTDRSSCQPDPMVPALGVVGGTPRGAVRGIIPVVLTKAHGTPINDSSGVVKNENRRETPSQRISFVSNLFLDELADLLFSRKYDLVFRDKQLVIHSCKCILNERLVLLRAEQDPNWRIIVAGHFMEPEPVHVRIQLAEIFVREGVDLQLYQDVAFQNPVIKDQVDKEMLPSDEDAFLPGLEAETPAKFEEEILQPVDQLPLEICFTKCFVRVQPEKLEDIRIPDDLCRIHEFGFSLDGPCEAFLVLRQSGSFIVQAPDLAL